MFCTRCGTNLDEKARFCSDCGAAVGGSAPPPEEPRQQRWTRGLYRSRTDAKVAGVCAGIARHFDIDVSIVRILWLAMTVYPPGVGFIAYIICWIAMPKEPYRLPASTQTVHSS
ncbi:MAG TPA: PspC domain-containing protein [Bryobacteraceae bacterium]|jgi:phage shock protein C|nr:PspC domain-containing protein [Bryobacteraceae bacterium]